MKLLVFCLYFANLKGTGPAFMRILSYIEFFFSNDHVIAYKIQYNLKCA
jgi:hypothetical protein